jgi:hypothetical protein
MGAKGTPLSQGSRTPFALKAASVLVRQFRHIVILMIIAFLICRCDSSHPSWRRPTSTVRKTLLNRVKPRGQKSTSRGCRYYFRSALLALTQVLGGTNMTLSAATRTSIYCDYLKLDARHQQRAFFDLGVLCRDHISQYLQALQSSVNRYFGVMSGNGCMQMALPKLRANACWVPPFK